MSVIVIESAHEHFSFQAHHKIVFFCPFKSDVDKWHALASNDVTHPRLSFKRQHIIYLFIYLFIYIYSLFPASIIKEVTVERVSHHPESSVITVSNCPCWLVPGRHVARMRKSCWVNYRPGSFTPAFLSPRPLLLRHYWETWMVDFVFSPH